MASWMIHLRVADQIMDRLQELVQPEFIMGNIAPDSGIPNEDWSKFTPDGEISHYRRNGGDRKIIEINRFTQTYLTEEQFQEYSEKQRSFYLGYMSHLLTDIYWSDNIWQPCRQKYLQLWEKDPKWVWEVKKDWYDLDFLYLQEHPDFRAFSIYRNGAGFLNEYLSFFGREAFDRRREDITAFYLAGREGVERDYQYLTAAEADRFTQECSAVISRIISGGNYDTLEPPLLQW